MNKRQLSKRFFHLIIIPIFIITAVLLIPNFSKLFHVFAAVETVLPTVETASFSGSGDIADDSAIWYNAANPTESVIIADNKNDTGGGIGVFDLTGKLLQFRQDGKIGNVDLRDNYVFGTQTITLVGANNRSNNTMVLYKLNPSTRQLEPIAGTRPTLSPNYGFCFYRSKISGKTYAFVTQNNGGLMEQYELTVSGSNINTTKVRSISIGSLSEGCVADDELGYLYVGEEDVALWKYNAEPSGGSTRTAVDTAGGGHLVADIEGLSIAYGSNGSGYLFASSQGDSTISVYQRGGNNAFVKSFSIGANGTIDAVTGTDGLDVMNANFGPAFPNGLLVAHDESNSGGTTSNLKYVPLDRIVAMTNPTPTPTRTPTLTPTLSPSPSPVSTPTCPALPTNTGAVDTSVHLYGGTYTVWSKMLVPAVGNSYYLQVGQTCAAQIADTIGANTWHWIAKQQTFTAPADGDYPVRLVGNELGVSVDKIMFLNNTCVPVGNGDNCTPAATVTPATTTAPLPTSTPTTAPLPTPTPTIASQLTPTPTRAPTPTPTPTKAPLPTATPVPAKITFQGATTKNNGSGATTLVISRPAGAVNGTIMVAQITVRAVATTITPPSGWTLIRRDNSSSSIGAAIYYRIATASEPTSYTWKFNTSQKASGGVAAYSGVNVTNPIDGQSGRVNSSTSTMTANSITTTTANDKLLYFGHVATATTVTPPTGMTERWEVTAPNSSGTTSEISELQLSAAGPVGNKTGKEGASNSNVCQLVALRAAQ